MQPWTLLTVGSCRVKAVECQCRDQLVPGWEPTSMAEGRAYMLTCSGLNNRTCKPEYGIARARI